ncbi:alpha/beta hydrolase [Azospirillum sp. B4]|uniref:alpha/beta hydrolase n=1 Tax=Azospirillum sp. B4 TaxID=95605 RepID=UPI00034776BA|nr:alpha/beta hydrolase [Azospirillum sp. B4]
MIHLSRRGFALGSLALTLGGCARMASSTAPGAAPPLPEGTSIPLWPEGPPGTIAGTRPEVTEERPPFGTITRNVSTPSLLVFQPPAALANGTAVIVAPGGGFHMLSIENEGIAVAKWLNSLGVTAFVLRYRLIPTGEDVGMQLFRRIAQPAEMQAALAPLRPLVTADGQQAVRLVRRQATRYGVRPDRIGLMGFSAGGAVTVWSILANEAASRPDFAMAIYPGLLPDPLRPPAKAPPLFALAAQDDAIAAKDTTRLAEAWRAAGLDGTLVPYPTGGHGFGMKPQGKPTDEWTARLRSWLDSKGLLSK